MAYPWQMPGGLAASAPGDSWAASAPGPHLGWPPNWQELVQGQQAAPLMWNGSASLPQMPPPSLSASSLSVMPGCPEATFSQSRLSQIERLVAAIETKLKQVPHVGTKAGRFEHIQGELMDLQSQLAYLMDAERAPEAKRLHEAPTFIGSPGNGAWQMPPPTQTPALTPAAVLPPPPSALAENGLHSASHHSAVSFPSSAAGRNGAPARKVSTAADAQAQAPIEELQASHDREVSLASTCHALQSRIDMMERSQSNLQKTSGRLADETRRLSLQRIQQLREQTEQAEQVAHEVAALRESEEVLRQELAKAKTAAAIADAQRRFADEVRDQQSMEDQERAAQLQEDLSRSQAELFTMRQEMLEEEQDNQEMIGQVKEHLATLLSTAGDSSLLELEGELTHIRNAQASRCARVDEIERKMAAVRIDAAQQASRCARVDEIQRKMAAVRIDAARQSCRQGALSARTWRQGHEPRRPRWALPQPPQQPAAALQSRHLRSPSLPRDYAGLRRASSLSAPSLTPKRRSSSVNASAEAPSRSPWSARRLPEVPHRSPSSAASFRTLPEPPLQQEGARLMGGTRSFFIEVAERVQELDDELAEAHLQSNNRVRQREVQHQRVEELERELQVAQLQARQAINAAAPRSSSVDFGASQRRITSSSPAAARECEREIARRKDVAHCDTRVERHARPTPREAAPARALLAPAPAPEQTLLSLPAPGAAALPSVRYLALQEGMEESDSDEEVCDALVPMKKDLRHEEAAREENTDADT